MSELEQFLSAAWDRLELGVADPGAATRRIVLATVDAEGRPQARTLVLRAASRSKARLEIQTDLGSAKIGELTHRPFGQFLAWDPEVQLQLRLSAEIHVLTGDAVEDRWTKIPDASRRGYGAVPKPGSPIPHALAYAKPADREGFAVLQAQVYAMDLVDLNEPHRRALFRAEDGWAGSWCVP